MIALRPYQTDLVERVRAEFARGAGSVVMQLPTGGGKTATASAIITRAVVAGLRCLFLAHLDSLVGDTHARLEAAGVGAGFVQAGRPVAPDAPVQVASLATLWARGVRPPADFVILDECHRAMGPTVRQILDAYPRAGLLGLTATPQRGDGQPLGDVFRALVCGPSVRELQAAGALVPVHVCGPSRWIDRGLAASPLAAWRQIADGSRAMVFAGDVEHARELFDEFEAAGVAVGIVTGDTPRVMRERLREAMRAGLVRVLINVSVFVEGFDLPEVETVILARGFTVCGAYLQAIGRGLRPAHGKTACTVVDLRGSWTLHGLPDEDRVWSLTGEAVARREAKLAVARCATCFAIFAPSAACPRCGAPTADGGAERVVRRETRGERLERVSALSQHERDRRYLGQLERVARYRIGLDGIGADRWAREQFRRRWRREPEVA